MANPATNFWSSSEMNDPKRNSRWVLFEQLNPGLYVEEREQAGNDNCGY